MGNFLSKWPLKMSRAFEAQAAHPQRNQKWVYYPLGMTVIW